MISGKGVEKPCDKRAALDDFSLTLILNLKKDGRKMITKLKIIASYKNDLTSGRHTSNTP